MQLRCRHYSAAAHSVSVLPSFACEDSAPFVPSSRKGTSAKNVNDSLCKRLLGLVYPRRSAVVAIQKWKDDGFTARKYELNRVVRQLRKFKRYKHALEVCEWMTTQKDMVLQPGDYALHLDLISKVRGVESAEKFFSDLPEGLRGHHSCTALLHCYVRRRDSAKAEALMRRMLECGFCRYPLPHNAIISLYISTGRSSEVPAAVRRLKDHASPDTVTYNLWLSACDDVPTADRIFLELESAKKVCPDWITFSILADLYARNSLPEKAVSVLARMEPLASPTARPAFSSILTLYAAVGRLDKVRHTWRRMKSWFRKLSDAEYVCMAAAIAKLSQPEEVEDLYSEWQGVSGTADPKVANLVLGAYARRGEMKSAEGFYGRAAGDGVELGYASSAVMARGYLVRGETERALECFQKAVSRRKKGDWWDGLLVSEFFEQLEAAGDFQRAERLLVMIRKAGQVTVGVYNSVLRVYVRAGTAPLVVGERMRGDGVEPDRQTRELIALTRGLTVVGQNRATKRILAQGKCDRGLYVLDKGILAGSFIETRRSTYGYSIFLGARKKPTVPVANLNIGQWRMEHQNWFG